MSNLGHMRFWWEDRENVATLAHWLIANDKLELSDVPKLIEQPKKWSVEWYQCLYELEHPPGEAA